METLQAIKNRRSVRKFKPNPIPKETIIKLLDAARLAPTARNVQPVEFVVITNAEARKKLALFVENGPFIKDAPVCVIIISKDTKYYLEDGCAATENLLLAIADLGLGACWVAGDKKDYSQRVLSLFKVPDSYKLVSMVALGFPEGKISEPPKKGLQDLIHWEAF